MKEEATISHMVKAKSRRYFFDVYDCDTGRLLTIKESRLVNGRKTQQIVNVWGADMGAFFGAFLLCLEYFDPAGLERTLLTMRDRCAESDIA